MNQKHWQNVYHVTVDLMVENVIHIKSRTTINVDVGEKIQESIMFVKKIKLES